MAKTSRSSIVGFHNIKNKVSRNAFDLSHRHLFTAQIGELLPVFVQWVNPNETFKLGYNGFSRTQPLQTAAFTRLRENVQYFFVPFQSLWKYFEQQVNNMTTGQSGENISRIASSFTTDSPITTKMPYINYNTLSTYLQYLLYEEAKALFTRYNGNRDVTITEYLNALSKEGYLVNGILRSASMAKLLRALGYGNSDIDTYDIVSNFYAYIQATESPSVAGFRDSIYGFTNSDFSKVTNQPNLSVFPLLAYHKIINDHYLYRQWQPYRSYLCNIDYLLPSDSMDFSTYVGSRPWMSDFFRIAQSNLPLDYFNGVLPKAQYGEESAASVDVLSTPFSVNLSGTTGQPSYGSPSSSVVPSQTGTLSSDDGTLRVGSSAASVRTPHTHTFTSNATATADSMSGALKISALRSAIALQKYKEIQESNDSDFASQVLAHFGVKPKHADYKSIFIGGGDSVIDINPQVNQNLADDNDAVMKATGAGQLSCGCKFTSDTYGIIIGIYRCVPQLDLAHVGIDRNLFKTDASDFPIPELDRLGMQTQYRCEVVAPPLSRLNSKATSSSVVNLDMSQTYGYLPRYSELKTSYDRYEGAFLNSLRSWVTGYDSNALDEWMRPRPFGTTLADIDALLTCRPSITKDIFVDQLSTTADNDKILIGSVNTC
jgi:hypothetical protein